MDDWTPPDTSEAVLLAVGGIFLVAGAISLWTRKAWSTTLTLPLESTSRIQPIDPAIGFFAMFFLPQMVYAVVSGEGLPESPPTTSATTEQPLPTLMKLACAFAGQLGAAVVMFALLAYRRGGNIQRWRHSFASFWKRVVQALAAYICVWPVCFALLHLTVYIMRLVRPDFAPPEHQTIRILISGEAGSLVAVLTVLGALVMAPVNEELFFRGLLQPLLSATSGRPWGAVVVCAVAFGLFHYPLVHTMPALTAFGLVLGYLRARTGSLALVILLHMIFNGKTLLWLALAKGSP